MVILTTKESGSQPQHGACDAKRLILPGHIKILALSGSLRTASTNTLLLRAVARLSPAEYEVCVYANLGALPLFNSDREAENLSAVVALKNHILAADAVIIASPEYAHGISGVMKNALDWMVGNESFVNKPVVLLNAAPRAIYAQQALRETLTMMSANIIEVACISVPILGSNFTEDNIVHHQKIAPALMSMLKCLHVAVQNNPKQNFTHA